MGKFCGQISKVDHTVADYMGISPYRAFLLRLIYANVEGKGTDLISEIYNPNTVTLVGKEVNFSELSDEQKEMFLNALLENIAKKLRNFQLDSRFTLNAINMLATDVSATFENLFEAIPSGEDRITAIDSIVQMFLTILDDQQAKLGKSRQDICNDDNGTLRILQVIKNRFAKAKIGSRLNKIDQNLLLRDNDGKIIEDQETKIIIKNLEQLDLAKSIYQNFEAIAIFALAKLLNFEGLKFYNGLNKVTRSTLSSLNKNNIEELFNYEASEVEHWLKIMECLSPTSTVGRHVRSALTSVPKYTVDEDGNVILLKNKLGFIEYESVSTLHLNLMKVLRGMTSSKDMINKMYKYLGEENNPVLQKQIELLLKKLLPSAELLSAMPNAGDRLAYLNICNQLRSAFYSDLKRNSSKYAIFNINRGVHNTIEYVRKYINASANYKTYYENFINRVRIGAVYNSDSKDSIHNDDINVALNNIDTVVTQLENIVNEDKSKNLTVKEKAYLLNTILLNIGIEANITQCYNLVKNNRFLERLENLRIQLKNVRRTQNSYHVYKNSRNFFSITIHPDNYVESVRKTRSGKPEYNSELAMAFRDLSRFIVKETAGDIVDAGLYKSNGKFVRMYTDILPSYMADRIEEIKNAAEEKDIQRIRLIIKDNFLVNEMFVKLDDLGRILDTDGNVWEENSKTTPDIRQHWLKLLWESDLNNEHSFANEFDWDRVLGDSLGKDGWSIDAVDFSDLDLSGNAIEMIRNFKYYEEIYSGPNSNRFNFANFPVFILGDANVSKTIVAPRINTEEGSNWVDFFYDIYELEKARMDVFKSTNERLKENNHNKVNKTDKNEAKFTFLRFLNNEKDFESKSIAEKKEIIAQYIEDEAKTFLKKMLDLGLYETSSYSRTNKQTKEKETIIEGSKHFKLEFKKSEKTDNGRLTEESVKNKLNSLMRDFYINNKLAMINQLLIMTVDVGYYKDSKDLQKRYKEIHAPGNELDVYAVWSESETGIEDYILGYEKEDNGLFKLDDNGNKILDIFRKGIYFEDIRDSVENYDPEFARVIALKFGIIEAMKTNKPFKNMSNEELIALGKTTSEYELYKDCTYTDGQSFITIDCYKKILVMRGLWDKDLETIYRHIKAQCEILKQGKISEEEKQNIIQDIIETSVIFQNLKPYSFGHEKYDLNNNGRKALIPTQYKCAEAVIIPEILPERSKLRALGQFLQDKHLDYACSTECIKVGNFGAINIDKKANGKRLTSSEITELLNSSFKDNPTVFDKNGKVAYIHKTKWTDYKIQTNVPSHMTGERSIGTLMRKIIIGGIKKGSNTDYSRYFTKVSEDGKIMIDGVYGPVDAAPTGDNIINLYNSLVACNIFDSLHKFKDKIGNVKNFAKYLRHNVMNTGRYSFTDLMNYALNDEQNGFDIELSEGGNVHDSAALLLSLFRNMVNKQMFNGCSLVQVSAWGINSENQILESADLTSICNKDNVLYYQCERPFMEEYIDLYGKTRRLKFNDYCYSDGTLKMSGKTTDDIEYASWVNPNYKEGDPENTKYLIPKIEVHFPGILDLIAYRIPTERNYSVLNLKTVRFNAPTAGSSIKVPLQTTRIAGFDFDIDKLYILRKTFMQLSMYAEDVSDIDADRIFTRIYEKLEDKEGVDIRKKLRDAMNKWNSTPHLYKEDRMSDLHEAWYLVEETNKYDKAQLLDETAEELHIAKSAYQWIDYDWTKAPSLQISENSKIRDVIQNKRNNALFHLMRLRLMDEETLQSRITPGGFTNATIAARVLRELMYNNKVNVYDLEYLTKLVSTKDWEDNKDPEPNWDPTDAYTMLYYNQQNLIASKLIGIFANANTFKQYASVAQEIKLIKPIKMMGHEYDDILNNKDGRDTDLTLAELLAASVDAVKDPVLNYLNLNQHTASIACLLGAIGYNLTEIGVFLNQPIIREAVTKAQRDKTSLSKALNTILKDDKFSKFDYSKYNDEKIKNNLSFNKLAKNLKGALVESSDKQDYSTTDEGLENQFIVALQLRSIFASANDFTALIQSTKFTASNAVTSTFGGLYNQQMKIDKFYQGEITLGDGTVLKNGLNNIKIVARKESNIFSPIMNDSNILDKNLSEYIRKVMQTPFAFELAMFDSNKALLQIIKDYFPYETDLYKSIRKQASTLMLDGVVSAETIDDIHEEILVELLEQMRQSGFNPTVIHHKEKRVRQKEDGTEEIYDYFVSNKEYFTLLFPDRLAAMTKDNSVTDKFPFLKKFVFNSYTDENNNVIQNTINVNKGSLSEAFDDEDFIQGWQLMAEDKTYGAIAFGLFFYNFHTGGFKYGYNSFMEKCPKYIKTHLYAGVIQLKKEGTENEYEWVKVTYQDLLTMIRKGEYSDLGCGTTQFIWNFVQKNPNNRDFVKNLFGTKKGDDLYLFLKALQSATALNQQTSLQISDKRDTTPVGTTVVLNSESSNSELYNSLKLGTKKISMPDGSEIKVDVFPVAIKVLNELYIANYSTSYADANIPPNISQKGVIRYTKVSNLAYRILDSVDSINPDNMTIEEIHYDHVVLSEEYKQIKQTVEDYINNYLNADVEDNDVLKQCLNNFLEQLPILPNIHKDQLSHIPIISPANLFKDLVTKPNANYEYFKELIIRNLLDNVFYDAINNLTRDQIDLIVSNALLKQFWNKPASWSVILYHILDSINAIVSGFRDEGPYEITNFKFADKRAINFYTGENDDVDFDEYDETIHISSEEEKAQLAKNAINTAEAACGNPGVKTTNAVQNNC